ncbi:hypothetical protein rosag_09150 [Roseisolibacter agri]|uniref:Uncharacterized protein n=1 Tax=Roseisolibacter agri TaxID=2014610 RepID=A0AA37V1W5_9BACT|nr:hypothetical protein rosag_09150 [Roseisolibacter agri]
MLREPGVRPESASTTGAATSPAGERIADMAPTVTRGPRGGQWAQGPRAPREPNPHPPRILRPAKQLPAGGAGTRGSPAA